MLKIRECCARTLIFSEKSSSFDKFLYETSYLRVRLSYDIIEKLESLVLTPELAQHSPIFILLLKFFTDFLMTLAEKVIAHNGSAKISTVLN